MNKNAQNTPTVVVVGGGMGGLAAAVDLAASGARVVVYDRRPRAGGKVRTVDVDGKAVDSGPTVVTMKEVFEDLFACAGARLAEHLELAPLPILARHAWPDGTRFDLFAEEARTLASLRSVFGAGAVQDYTRFIAYARGLYEEVEEPVMKAARPSLARAAWAIGRRGPAAIRRLDWRRNMWGALRDHFADPRLRQLFGRYATYYGSSPFSAPATLNLIAHAEKLGVWTARGGMQALADAVANLAERLGVEIHSDVHVARICVAGGRATGVELQDGTTVRADAVVSNVDPAALADGGLGPAVTRAGRSMRAPQRSLSAMTWSCVATASGMELDFHNVFFSDDYAVEFEALLGQRIMPACPTVYICAQDRSPFERVATGQPERMLMLINAPADGDVGGFGPKEIERCHQNMTQLLQRCGLQWTPHAEVVTTPEDFHRLFPHTGGALYGAATHRTLAPFSRPTAKTKVPGLYLVGGGAHPGAGVPMVTMGGRIAANEVRKDLRSTSGWRPAAISGGTSTSSPTTVEMR